MSFFQGDIKIILICAKKTVFWSFLNSQAWTLMLPKITRKGLLGFLIFEHHNVIVLFALTPAIFLVKDEGF